MLKNKLKQVLAFETIQTAQAYQADIETLSTKIEQYLEILQQDYQLIDYPKAIVWTTQLLTRTVFSTVEIPAFTNDRFICISPELSAWKDIYKKIHQDASEDSVVNYYRNLNLNFILQVLGHEFTHHIDLFLGDFSEDEVEKGIWFEEGMCEYLSRKYLLTADEFDYVSQIEWAYIMDYQVRYPNYSIEDFGSETYSEPIESIMYNYYVSFHTVKKLVENIGDIITVFERYHEWDKEGRIVTLSEYFNITIFD